MQHFPIFVLLVVVAVVFVLLITSGSNRRPDPTAQRGCPQCGTAHPHFAQFCRRCGRRLG